MSTTTTTRTRTRTSSNPKPMNAITTRRRSPRLMMTLSQGNKNDTNNYYNNNGDSNEKEVKGTRKRSTKNQTKALSTSTTKSTSSSSSSSSRRKRIKRENDNTNTNKKKKKNSNKYQQQQQHLPRTIELQMKQSNPTIQHIIGIDEAGRGPLAGPVVASAIIIPTNISGITDSKKITNEMEREELYSKIISSSSSSSSSNNNNNNNNVRYSIAIVDNHMIDKINILQATLLAMTMAVNSLIDVKSFIKNGGRVYKEASAKIDGCYVVLSNDKDNDVSSSSSTTTSTSTTTISTKNNTEAYYALVDGNRMPKELLCNGEPLVKGDSREYSIGAASILAKVTRDFIMKEYDIMYPEYELSRHKGYPTAAHMAKVKIHGASPIHRRSFAPLKHMTFDDHGKIIHDDS